MEPKSSQQASCTNTEKQETVLECRISCVLPAMNGTIVPINREANMGWIKQRVRTKNVQWYCMSLRETTSDIETTQPVQLKGGRGAKRKLFRMSLEFFTL
jgi:hypothetical protein